MAHFATGKIIRLNPRIRTLSTFIRLDIDPKTGPKDGYFELKLESENYNALYSLALAAAANRWPITIRTDGEIQDTEFAEIQYMLVDWEAGQSDDD
jgi:hypothetical protein